MNVGEYFTLEELTRTSVSLPNTPSSSALINLTRLVALILDRLREMTGELIVNSGYRCYEVNEAVGGSENSYHIMGLAADIHSPHMHIVELAACMLDGGIEFDKMILEYGSSSEWLHIQLTPIGGENRHIVLIAKPDATGRMVYKEARI